MGILLVAVGVVLACCAAAAQGASETGTVVMLPAPKDLVDNVPAEFPRFAFAGYDAQAQVLNRYLWHHFSTRLGHGNTLFNQEYVTTSDTWMGGALHPGWPKPVQELLREDLLSINLDPEGYVHTNQHFSHAHEQGWPFPLWIHNPTGPEGLAAGWHFQEDGPGWVWDHFRGNEPDSPFVRGRATEGWTLENVRSLGIVEKKWRLEAAGPSPAIVTPEYARIAAFNAPFLQLRWKRSGQPRNGVLPYVEWMRAEDSAFSPERRMYFGFDTGNPAYEQISGTTHSMIPVHRHPLWNSYIKRIRIALAPGESNVTFNIDSFFTVYDTRHTINNPIYIMACWNYFRWTGDLGFLRAVINKMRPALRYQQTAMGGLGLNHIRDTWVGHDGLPGFTINPDGKKTVNHGHGIGSNYWDILPFGWDDFYATYQYYAATSAMAEVEQALLDHPDWDVPGGALALEPESLRKHAGAVKEEANRLFWNGDKGRFAACIDQNGVSHEYGFTFLNLDAIWYGIASDEHARAIMDWLDGKRVVEADTSTGADIYHWRFGPRATTKRNLDWYFFCWTAPESIPWGGQVQDGGAVLGFTLYDLWARLHVLGPDNAWERLCAILDWDKEVWAEGGYRTYYEGGKRGTTLQGGGTAGGLGIDAEFFESSLMPSIVVYGFLGLEPKAADLAIHPRLPKACSRMGLSNLLYRGALLDVQASDTKVAIAVKTAPQEPLRIRFENPWKRTDTGATGTTFELGAPGTYTFERAG